MPHAATIKKRVWKPRFIEELRKVANVSQAAKNAGVDRKEVYRERERSQTFKSDWDDALEEGVDAMEAEARRRAVEGTVVPVVSAGRHVADVTEYSDTLLIFLLKGRRPEVFKDRQDITSAGRQVSFTVELGEGGQGAGPNQG